MKGYFGGFHILYVGGYLCMSWASLFCSWSRGSQDKGPDACLFSKHWEESVQHCPTRIASVQAS